MVSCLLHILIIMFLQRISVTLFILLITISPLIAHVYLINPNGGETYDPGQIIQIEWQEVIKHDILNWDILFSPDGGVSWDTVKSNIPMATMNYSWEIPYISTSEGRIKIVQDNVYEDYEDVSGDFEISSVTGIKPQNENRKVNIYPNPVTEYSLIEFDNEENKTYAFTLYNINGQKIRKISDIRTNRIELEITDLSRGIYFFHLNSDTGSYFKGNFIVQ